MTSQTPHSNYGTLATGHDTCFLCGDQSTLITQEHVFPKWLQKRHNLWDQRLTLLNGTTVPYRDLKIPCCAECNNQSLSKLENVIRSAVLKGYTEALATDGRLWFLWAGKIFYGILRTELHLLEDRSAPAGGTIVPERLLKTLSTLHLFLQGIRQRHDFAGDPPYSVLICNVHDLGKTNGYFMRDSLAYLTLSIRMGEVGVIVVFEDHGLTTDSYGRYVSEVGGRKLHPLQFDELYAKVRYQASLVENRPHYQTAYDTNGERTAKTDVFSNLFLREWSQEEYSEVLRIQVQGWMVPSSQSQIWFTPPNLVPTWMANPDGTLLLKSYADWAGDGISEGAKY